MITITDIENHKLITNEQLHKDLAKLKKFDARTNVNSFIGNNFLYHYQFKNLLKCYRNDSKKTIYDIYNDNTQWSKLLTNTIKRNRKGKTFANNVYECFRVNLGSVVMFKSTTAKYLYKKYNATSVLDPTAGWGGRMLGAWALGINYTGIDTNIEMKDAYNNMIDFLYQTDSQSQLKMIFDDCMTIDFSKINYDFVLTSPPYINLEIYEHMKLFESDMAFYKNFLIPLWYKCIDNIQTNGHVCFNINPKMYDDAIKYGLPIAQIEENLLQQLGQQKNKKKQDKIYIWKKMSSK